MDFIKEPLFIFVVIMAILLGISIYLAHKHPYDAEADAKKREAEHQKILDKQMEGMTDEEKKIYRLLDKHDRENPHYTGGGYL